MILIFSAALLLFSLFQTKVLFTDVSQYVNTAKEFAGIATSKVRVFSSAVYPWFLGQFLKIMPSMATLKILNVLWLILDAILLYWYAKRKETLLIFMFAPVVWYVSAWINPILPVSFFLLLAYVMFKKYEELKEKKYFVLSALSLGLTATLWLPAFYLSVFFIIAFFYNKKLSTVLYYLAVFLITFSLRLAVEHYYFNFPLFTFIRGLGSNFLFLISSEETVRSNFLVLGKTILLILLSISPLFFRIYRIKFKSLRKEIIFLALSFILFFGNANIRYFIVLMPILAIIFTDILKEKEIKWHIIFSVFLVIFLTSQFFGITNDYLIKKDLDKIEDKYPREKFIVGAEGASEEQAMFLSTLYWGDKIEDFATFVDYKLDLRNENIYRQYKLSSDARINDIREIEFIINYKKTDEKKDYDDYKYLILIGDEGKLPNNFKFLEKYNVLRVYTNEDARTERN